MRRTVRSVLAALVVAAAVLVPALPASAAIPDPVIPLPVTGSQLSGIWQNVPGVGEDSARAYLKMYAAFVDDFRRNGGTMTQALIEGAKTVPKPVALPTVITRGTPASGAAGGAVLTAGMLGWGIGSNGTLAVIAAVQGSSYENVFCSQPGWYQGVTGFVNFGIAPDCTVAVTTPNADASAANVPISYPALGYQWHGARSVANGNWAHCFQVTSTPAGMRLYYATPGSQSNLAIPNFSAIGSGFSGNCTAIGKPGSNYGTTTSGAQPLVRLYRESDNSLIASEAPGVADPQRTLSCRVKWSNGTTTTGTGASYKEGGGLPISLAGTGCGTAWSARPSGTIPEKISVDSDGGTGIRTINEHDIAPEMMPAPGGDGSGLRLDKVVGTTATSCMTWEANCSNWWTETDSGQVPGVYRCTFGGSTVALTECGPYRYTFDVQTSSPTITNPSTGQSVDWASAPSTGNSTNPGTGPGTGQWPADQCFADGYSSVQNPVDWVLLPIKCALVWAFVPRQTVVDTTTATMAAAWDGTMPGQVPLLVAPLLNVPTVSGCAGPRVTLSIPWAGTTAVYDGYPLSACNAPVDQIAAIARTIGAAILIYMTLLGVVRRASAVVNAPGVGSGGSS